MRSALELRGRLTAAGEKYAEAQSQLNGMHAAVDLVGGASSSLASNSELIHKEAFAQIGEQTAPNSTQGQPKRSAQRSTDRSAAAAVMADLLGSSDEDEANGKGLQESDKHAADVPAATPPSPPLGQTCLTGRAEAPRLWADPQHGLAKAAKHNADDSSHQMADASGPYNAALAQIMHGQQASDGDDAWPDFEGPLNEDAQLSSLSGGTLQVNSIRHRGADDDLQEAWPSFAASGSEDDAPLGVR